MKRMLEKIFLTEHHAQTLCKNYFGFGDDQFSIPSGASRYYRVTNNGTQNMMIFPSIVFVIETSPSSDVNVAIYRYINSDPTGATFEKSLTSLDYSNVYSEKKTDLAIDVYTEFVTKGTKLPELSSGILYENVVNEESRGERYILHSGETMLVELDNNASKDLNVSLKAFWSYVY